MKRHICLLVIILVSCTPNINEREVNGSEPTEVQSISVLSTETESNPSTSTPIPATADIQWTSIGPGGGGWMPSMAFSPPNTLYIGCDVGGIFRSRDGGLSYEIINSGLQNYVVLAIAVHPEDSNIVYLGTEGGIYKSSDSGDNWTWLRNGFPPIEKHSNSAPISSVAIDLSNPDTVFAGVGDSNWHRFGQGNIYKSVDGGDSWIIVSKGSSTIHHKAIIYSILIHPTDSKMVLISTDYGVYKSIDGGVNWEEKNEGLPHNNARKMVMHPSDPDIIYLSINSTPTESPWRGGVYKSIDGGETWQEKTTGLGKHIGNPGDHERITANYENILIDPQNPNILYVGAVSWWDAGIYKTYNGGESWKNVMKINNSEPGWIYYGDWGPIQGESMAIDPINPERVFSADAWQVFGTEDGGESWQQIYTNQVSSDPPIWQSRGLETTVVYDIEVAPGNSDVIYLGYADIGIHKSDDGGKTFQHFTQGLADDFFDIEIDPQNPNVIFASATRWSDNYADIIKSEDSGQTWQIIGFPESDMPDLIVSSLLLDEHSPFENRVIYAATFGAGVYKSNDGGISWVEINYGLGENGNRFVSSLIIDPNDPNVLYAGVHMEEAYSGLIDRGQYGGVYKTEDGGNNWRKVDQEMPNVLGLAVDLYNPQIIYASTREFWDSTSERQFQGGVYQSLDGGENWQRILNDPFVKLVETDPHQPGVVYAGTADHPYHDKSTGNGMYRSDDYGLNWYQVNDNLSNLAIWAFEIDPNNPNIIYAGTGGTGVFKGIIHE